VPNQSNQLNRLIFIACILVLIALAVIRAPSFLIVSDAPVKSDAVVLFLGGEKGTREKEANQLITEGYADYLIIPAYRQVKKLSPDGTLVKTDLDLKLDHLKLNTPRSGYLKLKTASWVEDTHQETLIARDMMAALGFKSAILVSSPYHMRRIKIIADKVFGETNTLSCVPTRHETSNESVWVLENYKFKFVMTEYAKITWFHLYSPFV
jgi:hypothetical protein